MKKKYTNSIVATGGSQITGAEIHIKKEKKKSFWSGFWRGIFVSLIASVIWYFIEIIIGIS